MSKGPEGKGGGVIMIGRGIASGTRERRGDSRERDHFLTREQSSEVLSYIYMASMKWTPGENRLRTNFEERDNF